MDFPGSVVVGTSPSDAGWMGMCVWFLVRELGSHMSHGMAKKSKHKTEAQL